MTTKAILTTLTIAAIVAVIAVAVVPAFAQRGQNRPGEHRNIMSQMMYLERSWTAVSFQLECTEEQISQLEPTYASALEARNTAFAQVMQNRDRQAYLQAITECRSTLDARLREVLSDQQMTKLGEIMQPRRQGGAGGGR